MDLIKSFNILILINTALLFMEYSAMLLVYFLLLLQLRLFEPIHQHMEVCSEFFG